MASWRSQEALESFEASDGCVEHVALGPHCFQAFLLFKVKPEVKLLVFTCWQQTLLKNHHDQNKTCLQDRASH